MAKPAASVVTVHVLAFAGRPGESTYGADAARGAGALGLALGVAGGEGVAEPVGEGVEDGLDDVDGLAVCEGVGDGEAVAELLDVDEGDNVGVGVGVTSGEGVGVAEAAVAVGDRVGVDVLVTVAAGVRVDEIPVHDVAEMTKLSMRNVPVAPDVPVKAPRIRKAKPALPAAAALKATVLQQYHPAVVGVEIDAGVPSAAKVPAAPVVESSVAHTFGPVALW